MAHSQNPRGRRGFPGNPRRRFNIPQELLEMRSHIDQLLETLHNREMEMLAMKTALREQDEQQEGKEVLQARIQLLQEKNESLQARSQFLHSRNEFLEAQNQSVLEENQTLKEGKQFLQEQNHILQEQNRILQEDNKTLQEQNQTLKEEKQFLQEQNHILQEQNHILQEQNCILQEQNRILQEDNKTLQEQNQTLKEEKQFLQEQNHILQEEKHTLQEQNQTLQAEKTKIKDTNKILVETIKARRKLKGGFRKLFRGGEKKKTVNATEETKKVVVMETRDLFGRWTVLHLKNSSGVKEVVTTIEGNMTVSKVEVLEEGEELKRKVTELEALAIRQSEGAASEEQEEFSC
ncbi:ninein-like [Salarias fasciatus]|uniref:ninein-like n=1 Tax=Salarias fasciatus TaxID=181472 RepID=UPI001176B159|nr:ninein-like [Salarias fasciatus]